MVAEPTSMELTEDEAELYDRQIRLWGLDSQKRLRNAKILLIGLKGFGAETAKNIILAGVKSVTFLDEGLVTEEDGSAQFLAPRDSVGKYRADESLARAQCLNPMVEVTADHEKLQTKNDDYFAKFDVIIATGCNLSELKRINTACRIRNVKFFCGDVFGMFGYMFADLQIHEYAEEVTKFPVVKPDEQGDRKKKVEPVKVTVKKSETFVPLVETLSIDWTNETNAKKMKKMDFSYFLLRVLFEFQNHEGHAPAASSKNEDLKKLINLRASVLNDLNVPVEKVPDSVLDCLFGEVSPVCAIVGGVLSQEVIKTVSQKEAPHNNFFFFNPETCCGFVENFSNQE